MDIEAFCMHRLKCNLDSVFVCVCVSVHVLFVFSTIYLLGT